MVIDFCVPVKDEEPILEANALKIYNYLKSQSLNYDWRIIILVNGSKDNSYNIAKLLENKDSSKFKAFNMEKGEKSLALKEYFKNSEADILSFMDADLAVALENIGELINPFLTKDYDLVIGSRLLPTSKIKRSYLREFSSRGYNKISRLLFKNNIHDLQCGFKAFKKSLFDKISPYLRDNKWFFDTELILLAIHFNYRVKEIPVDWEENRYYKRKSKVKKIEAYGFIKKLFQFKKYLKKIA